MKAWIKSLFPKAVWRYLDLYRQRWFTPHAKKSYSQEGEDIILDRFFEQRHTGFYVDIGAHHPVRFSNTYRLYRRGWNGLNVDANPGSMWLFKRIRSRDINVEAAVSSTRQTLTYYAFNEPALNTLNKDLAIKYMVGPNKIINEIRITTVLLSELLDKYVPANTRIDLLTIDVEGLDYDVLLSNNWQRYSPQFILVECLGCSTLDRVSSDPIAILLFKYHYFIAAKTFNTVLFRLEAPESSSDHG